MSTLLPVMALAAVLVAPMVAAGHDELVSHTLVDDEPLYASPTRWDRIGRIAAPVLINGQGPFRMILDTGANQSVITTRVARVLNIPLESAEQAILNGVTGSSIVPMVPLHSLRTGDLNQEGIRVAVLDSVMGGADGILGVQGFDGLRVTVDFVRDEIKIARSRGERARSTDGTIPAKLHFGRLLVVDGYVGRIRVKAVIDTGAEVTLGNSALRNAMYKRRRAAEGPDDAIVVGLDDQYQSGRYLFVPLIRLGDAYVGNVPIIYGDIHVFKMWGLEDQPALLIGMDILGSLDRLVIDYRREEIHFRNR